MNKADESLRVLEDIYQESYVTDVRITNALSFAIETIKSIQSAESELPYEDIFHSLETLETYNNGATRERRLEGYRDCANRIIKDLSPIVAKLRAKVTELESRCGGCVL